MIAPSHGRISCQLLWGFIALAGLGLGWHKGQLPLRDAPAPTANQSDISPDLALYRDVIADVRSGRDYYAAAKQHIPQYGFPIHSPLNWRLPTYAWALSSLPDSRWIQAVLIVLSCASLAMAFAAQTRSYGILAAALSTLLLFGVVQWAIDGQAFLAQEPWCATLLLISLAAHALSARRDDVASSNSQPVWQFVAFLAGIAALFFRELALPYCGLACLFAAWHRRWFFAAVWAIGIAAFFAFYVWHVGQVAAQLASEQVVASAGIGQWLRLGGLDFVLLTTRLNSLLFAAPSFLLWAYLLISLFGLGSSRDEASQLACLTALAYLLAFAIIGRPENFYWGLLPAPFLAWGTVPGVLAILAACRQHPLASPCKPLASQG